MQKERGRRNQLEEEVSTLEAKIERMRRSVEVYDHKLAADNQAQS